MVKTQHLKDGSYKQRKVLVEFWWLSLNWLY